MDNPTINEIHDIINVHRNMLEKFESRSLETVASIADALTRSLKQGGTVFICGNGGSAADAQHIAGELVGRFETERKALPAVALTTDTSVITSIANDVSYESVFSRQVEALVHPGDILWAISTSGRSPNVMAAAELAKQKDALVIAFTGRAESTLEKIADICLCAPNESTARSQEIHQLAYHIICKLVEQDFSVE